MKSKKISNSKYKNTGVLFELMVRQITAETLDGTPNSPALKLMKEYFNVTTEMGKELQLYRALYDNPKPLSETKALNFIDLVVEQRKKLDDKKLAREKYNLVKSIKESYNLEEFLSSKIDNYTLYASIYKTFLNETSKEKDYQILNIRDVATARFTIVENLVNKKIKKGGPTEVSILEDFRRESEEVRLLAYKLVIDKFNEKYTNLNDKQKSLLREYINNVTNTNSLSEYVNSEIPVIKSELIKRAGTVKDKIVSIKLNEVASQLDVISRSKVIKDNEITALMIAYEILKEVS